MGIEADEISKRVGLALDKFDISHIKCRQPYQLSGGEKRRVALASIWVTDPDIWILDEPWPYLDEKFRVYINEWIIQLCNSGKTVIVLGH